MTTTLLAQLSDLHIREPGRLAYGRLDTAPYLRAAVRSVLGLRQRPDAVVLTGDLTDFGRADADALAAGGHEHELVFLGHGDGTRGV